MESKKKVVIIGGGFGGLNAAKVLVKKGFEVVLVDRVNHHLFQPLLYQVASAALSPVNIAFPLREIFAGKDHIEVQMGTVTSIQTDSRTIEVDNSEIISYDFLIVAVGARHFYFGHDEWESFAPGLKTANDALIIRKNILCSFEKAERETDPQKVKKYLRFVVIGGGPTGVEMAGAIAEISQKTMFKNFRHIKPEQAEIYLVEGVNRVLSSYPEPLSANAKEELEKMHVKVLTGTTVTKITEDGVYLGDHYLETTNVIWAAGNKAPEILKTLNVPLDKLNRVIVGPDLSIPGHPDVFVIGDAAHVVDKEGNVLPGIAPVAIQQGKYVAKLIINESKEKGREPFEYDDKGSMATIGVAKAVALIGKRQFTGFFAWLLWGLIHIFFLISFRNRIFVMMDWFFLYLTNRRQARIILDPLEFEDHKHENPLL